MKDRDLIKQLNAMANEVKPQAEWKQSQRSLLLQQISAQLPAKEQAKKSFVTLLPQYFYEYNLKPLLQFSLKPVAGLGMLVMVVLGGSSMTIYAQHSVPGDRLYTVKRAMEKAQYHVTLKEDKRILLQVRFATERLKELDSLHGGNTTEQPDENIKKVAIDLKNNLDSVHDSFNTMKDSADNSESVVSVARQLDQESSAIQQKLRQFEDGQDDVVVEAALLSATAVANNSVDTIVHEYEDGDINIDPAEVHYLVSKKSDNLNVAIFNLENSVRDLGNRLNIINIDDPATQDLLVYNQKKMTEIQDQLDTEVNDLTAKVFKTLSNNDYFTALDLITQGFAIINQLDNEVLTINNEVDGLVVTPDPSHDQDNVTTDFDSGETEDLSGEASTEVKTDTSLQDSETKDPASTTDEPVEPDAIISE